MAGRNFCRCASVPKRRSNGPDWRSAIQWADTGAPAASISSSTTERSSALRSWPPERFGPVLAIQPRAPILRLDSPPKPPPDAPRNVLALEAHEIDAFTVLGEEAADRLVRLGRLQELDVADPRRQDRVLEPELLGLRAVMHREPEEALEPLDRGVQIAHDDRQLDDITQHAAPPWGGRADHTVESPGSKPDLHTMRGRDVARRPPHGTGGGRAHPSRLVRTGRSSRARAGAAPLDPEARRASGATSR